MTTPSTSPPTTAPTAAPAAGSSVSGVSNNLTVNVALTFKSAFGGAKNVYMCALDQSGLSSNWQQGGTWTVPNPNNQPPNGRMKNPTAKIGWRARESPLRWSGWPWEIQMYLHRRTASIYGSGEHRLPACSSRQLAEM